MIPFTAAFESGEDNWQSLEANKENRKPFFVPSLRSTSIVAVKELPCRVLQSKNFVIRSKPTLPFFVNYRKSWMRRNVERLVFSRRGAVPGADLDDWLRAEREIVWSPQAELVEGEKEVRIQIAAPGLEPGRIHVTALPETIIVKGETAYKHKGGEGAVQFCEFSEKTLFRRFELDNRIEVERVSATLEKGILRIAAPKAMSAPGRHVPVSRS